MTRRQPGFREYDTLAGWPARGVGAIWLENHEIAFTMATYRLQLDQPRPFFAEIPYYLWGQVNYDSEGDCKQPTDRQWTWLYLQHRGTQEVVEIKQVDGAWLAEGNDETA